MEHRKPSSSTSEVARHIHQDCPGHAVSLESVKILDRDPSWFDRRIKRRSSSGHINQRLTGFILPLIRDTTLT